MITTQTLKNAARAIECDLWTDPATKANYLAKDGAILRRWEPLEDDGDALRLAVQIGLNIWIYYSALETPSTICSTNKETEPSGNMYVVTHCGDAYAATRRAIVRAASEIGAAKCQS